VCFLQDSTSSVRVHLYKTNKSKLIFSGNDKQLINTVTDATELINPDNLFDDPFVSQPSLRELIESEPSVGDDPLPMSPTIPISTIDIEFITLPPSMSAENKSSNQTLPTTRPIKKRKVTVQDLQRMQMEILELEREKISVELENAKLIQKKLKLEVKEAEEAALLI
jgi:hypothetical protein